jgi:hypothetical protein
MGRSALFRVLANMVEASSSISNDAIARRKCRGSATGTRKVGMARAKYQTGQDFFQAASPGLYLPLRLKNPVYLDVLETGDLTRPQYVDLSIRQLNAKQVRYILWSPRLDSRDAFSPPEAYHLTAFREFLNNQYRCVWTFSDQDQIWERK